MSDRPDRDPTVPDQSGAPEPRTLPEPGLSSDPGAAQTGNDQPRKGEGSAGSGAEKNAATQSVWIRGLHMLIFAVLFNVAQSVLVLAALLQFLWLLFAKERNAAIADFGEGLGRWLRRVALFQVGATEEKPFPWDRWDN